MTRTAAPTTPDRSPALAWTIWSRDVASGSERRYTTSRTPASSGSPACDSEPPITMTLGLSRLTALASTSPIVRPASRTSRVAGTEPPRTRPATSRLDSRVHAHRAQPGGDRRAAGHGFEATHVPAAAHRIDVVGDLDVAEVAGGALGTAAQLPVADDAAADSRGNLDEHEVVDVAEADGVLPERHHVDVVVDDDDDVERGADERRHVEAVPAGHDRRVGRAAGGVLDRARAARCRRRPGRAGGDRRSTAAPARVRRSSRAPPPARARRRGRRARWR